MLSTLHPQPAPLTNTHALPAPTLPKPVQTARRRGDLLEGPQARRPLVGLPKLPTPVVQAPIPNAPIAIVAGPDASAGSEARDAQGRLALRNAFVALRTGEHTMWQKLSLAAHTGPSSLFASAVRDPAPNWSNRMVKTFLNENDLERWSLLPGVTGRAAALSLNREGPLKLLPVADQLSVLNTTQQYSVMRSPRREHDFAKLKKVYGSHYAFHGSPLRNWHQILTQGLEPKSGTALQAHGAAHGKGVYVATISLLSEQFMGKEGRRVLGLVEVIKHPSVTASRDAWIAPSKVFATLRAIAVYEDGENVPDLKQDVLDAHFTALAKR